VRPAGQGSPIGHSDQEVVGERERHLDGCWDSSATKKVAFSAGGEIAVRVARTAPKLALRDARNDGRGEQGEAERRAGYRPGAELIRAGGSIEWYASRLGYQVVIEFRKQDRRTGVTMMHPDGGPELGLTLDPDRARSAAGYS
jgi:hypothetical protein